ncbi:MAG: type II toxin-antitoxin system HicA family toxin [Candidatus Niyogibacteria bacterium]|nr:type II toxin-antitoxin system HicA family toxin [Candidatus Niyogibacteria bacterium]
MSKLKPIRYDEFARKLRRAGYIPIRKNRHLIYFHQLKQITIPLPHKHPRDIPIGLLRKLIKEMRISIEEFNRL